MKSVKTAIIFSFFLFAAAACSSQTQNDSSRPVTEAAQTTAVSQQTATSFTTSEMTTPVTTTVQTTAPRTSYTIDVDYIYQEPELPTGCEITSLTMLLNYLGFDIEKTELSDNYLEMDYMAKVGFDDAFIGNPRWVGGYGCYAPVIEDTANKYLSDQKSSLKAKDISGTPFTALYTYIDNDMPVVVWASMGMMEVEKNFCYFAEDGDAAYWYDNEHCMLLVGYNKDNNTVTAADPLAGLMLYNADRFEYIYDKLEKQAVIIE